MCARATYAKPIGTVDAPTLKDCADACAKQTSPPCQTADWNNKKCALKSEYIPTIAGRYDTWVPVSKREERQCPSSRISEAKASPQIVDTPQCPNGKP